MVIGIVILSGVLSSTVFTLFVVPVAYSLLSKKSRAPEEVGRILEKEQATIWQRVNLINFAFIAIKASSVYPNFHSSESFVAYLQAQSTGSNGIESRRFTIG